MSLVAESAVLRVLVVIDEEELLVHLAVADEADEVLVVEVGAEAQLQRALLEPAGAPSGPGFNFPSGSNFPVKSGNGKPGGFRRFRPVSGVSRSVSRF